VTQKYEEKHMINPPPTAGISDDRTHHYALHINKDSTFEIYVDNEKVREGSLFTDFDPPVNPPKTIDDPEHKKPVSWDDRKEIPDPFAVQPEDWDPEEAVPRTCSEAKNKAPQFKGSWKPPMIANPKYAGPFPRRQIPNPDFYEDLHPNRLAPIGGIAFEILVNSFYVGFDNLLITTSKGMAREFAEKTWRPRYTAELDYELQERIKQIEADEKEVAEIRRQKAESDAKKNAPKTEEERWQRKETELNSRWEKGEIDFDTAKLTAQFIIYKYKAWGAVAIRWIEKKPLVFIAALAGLFLLRYAMKSLRKCLRDRKKKRKDQQKTKKAKKEQ